MISKIFKTTAYTLMMVMSLYGYGHAQETSSAKEKTTEEKLKQMEAKLNSMQKKLDSIQANDQVIAGNGIIIRKKAQKPAITLTPQTFTFKKIAPLPAIPPSTFTFDAFGPNSKFEKSMQSLKKINWSISDEKLQEKIKSGEVKLKTKNYTKTYNISSGDKLQIDNRYGKVTVNTWNKNEFKVDVEVRGLANDDDEAQKIVDGVSINDSKEGSVVSFTTNIEKMGNSWEIHNNNNGKDTFHIHKTEVNYVVYIPSKNALTITNRYGNVSVPDFGGKLTINTSYGSFIAKELTNTENDINTRYTEVDIEAVNGGSINCSYGNMVKIGVANNLNLETRYVAADVARLKTAGTISTHYGSGLKISDLDKSVKTLNINSSYAPVAVGVKNGNNFDFDITLRYSPGFKYNDDVVKVTSKTPGDDERRYSNTKNYKGYVGKSNNDAKVTITTSYQPVQFL